MATETRAELERQWRELFGDSDSGSDEEFHGFELCELKNLKEESDVDLDVVVNNEQLLQRMLDEEVSDVSSVSSPSDSDDSIGAGGDLPTIARPRKRKRASVAKRNEVTSHFSSRIVCCKQ